MKIKLSLVILFIFLIASFPSIAFANLLINGDFEWGNTSGWTSEWNDNIFGASNNPQNGT